MVLRVLARPTACGKSAQTRREPAGRAASLYVCAQRGAVPRADVTRVGKCDEPAVEMEETLQRFGGKRPREKRQGGKAVNSRLKVSIFLGKAK